MKLEVKVCLVRKEKVVWFLKCQFWDIGRNPAGYNEFEVRFRNQEFGRVSLSRNGICKQKGYL